MAEMGRRHKSIVDSLASEGIRLGADALEVEYKDGYEEVWAASGEVGHGIARLRSASPAAAHLRRELYGIIKKRRRLIVGDSEYELRARVYDSFGEDAFRVQLRRV